MEGATVDAQGYLQSVNTIYTWTRLLQVHPDDAALRARALERIQQNAEHLLRQIQEKSS